MFPIEALAIASFDATFTPGGMIPAPAVILEAMVISLAPPVTASLVRDVGIVRFPPVIVIEK